ncbi:hypothetical protein BGY98DRAFT_1128248 [Russula aff. rugulosa BPL654]|nr:hypothetical protein BGY98DRAFT_1128248 [Russula aff. rugulosa BPL654]
MLLRPPPSAEQPSVPTNGTERPHGRPSPGQGAGGPGPHDDPPAPQGVDQKIWEAFLSVDTDRSRTISATELQTALKGGNWPSTNGTFEIDTIKLLMTLFDFDRNGTIDIHEFDGLWNYIKEWEGVFRHYDRNHNDYIDGDELGQALERFGYPLTPQLQNLLKRKYARRNSCCSPAGHSPPPPGISFDRFIRACVVVKQLKKSFDALDRDPNGRVKIKYKDFLKMVFELP